MIRKLITAFIVVVVVATISHAAEWKVDKAHSSVGFSVTHMVISKVTGKFEDFDGKVNWDGKYLEDGSVEFSVDVASVDTDNEKRDNHLKSDDFFDAEKYPEMTFKSNKITADGNSFSMTGDLTIRDVTREVTFACEFLGTVKDPWGNTRAGFSAITTINRQDFNVHWSKVIETGGLVVSNEVEIQLNLEFIEQANPLN